MVQWWSPEEMGKALISQILDKTVCILHRTNTLGKVTNLIILQVGINSNFGMATDLEEGKFWMQTC